MKHFFTFLLLVSVWAAQAQPRKTPPPPPDAPRQLARAELPLDPDNDEVQVQSLPADTSVVLFIRHTNLGRHAQYTFQRYGHDLRLRHEAKVEGISDEYSLRRMCSEPGVVYALFGTSENRGKLLVAAFDVRRGRVWVQPFDTKLARNIVSLKALDGRLLTTVTLSDEEHQTVLLLDVDNGKFQFLSTVYEPLTADLTSVADRSGSHQAEFILSQSNGRKRRLLLKRMSAEHGQLLKAETVQTESERSLLTAQLSPLADTTTRLLAGTYALRDLPQAQGLFATDLTTTAADKPALRFYDFRRLRHFFDYLNPAREARLRERAARREAREAPPIHWRYNLLLHEMLPQSGGGYVLVAEVYNPVFNYPSYSVNSFSPLASLPGPGLPLTRPYTGTNYYNGGRLPVGYRTSHVVVCSFDRRGNMLWDNTFVLNDEVVRSELEEAVQPLALADGRLVLAYLTPDNELHYKCIRQSEAGDNDRHVELLPFSSNSQKPDRILDTHQPDVYPWTNNQFIASGFQRIKGSQGPERQVFFLQALAF